MTSEEKEQVGRDADGNVLLRARNGDVIRFDETGLILKLSDKVVDDLRQRLDPPLDAEVLGDIDAWGVRRRGDWFHFSANLPGTDGPRGYRRRVEGGDIIAETPGPVLGVLSLGGARRARAFPGRGTYPYHVVAPSDEIGAVGLAGLEPANATDHPQVLREQTSDSMLAEEMLQLRQVTGRGLPLIVARAETDKSASVAELASGMALANLLQAAENLGSMASNIGKEARLACVSVDFSVEDVLTPEADFASSMRGMLDALSAALWQRGFDPRTVVTMFDSTSPDRRQAQWELALTPARCGPVFTVPSYALGLDQFSRLGEARMRLRAKTDAAALAEIDVGRGWQCPLFLLAEWEGKSRIRLRSNAILPLQIDPEDPFGAGPAAGVRIEGPDGEVGIAAVTVDPSEPRDLLIDLADTAPRRGLRLSYAWDGPGGVRDGWVHPLGEAVWRWALPAQLEVHG